MDDLYYKFMTNDWHNIAYDFHKLRSHKHEQYIQLLVCLIRLSNHIDNFHKGLRLIYISDDDKQTILNQASSFDFETAVYLCIKNDLECYNRYVSPRRTSNKILLCQSINNLLPAITPRELKVNNIIHLFKYGQHEHKCARLRRAFGRYYYKWHLLMLLVNIFGIDIAWYILNVIV